MIEEPRHWLLLIHRLPPKPAYLRVKVSRRLQKIGAVALKNTVYLLPTGDEAREDFAWIAQEVRRAGGEAVVGELTLIDGITNREVEQLFRTARSEDADSIARAASELLAKPPKAGVQPALRTLERRLKAVKTIDFFGAEGLTKATGLLQRLKEGDVPEARTNERSWSIDKLRGLTWVTRSGVRVDRIASAWLVRRFVDPEARFRFVDAKTCGAAVGELRFDMFEGELTHEGDCCTFEVILNKLGLSERGLRDVAEIIHDIDLKDGRYGRPETDGVAALIAGVCQAAVSDDERLARGFVLLDGLLAAVKSGAAPPPVNKRPKRGGTR
jgi:hypothetical protein